MALETTHQFEFRTALYALLVAGKTSGAALEHVQISMFPLDPDKALAPEWVELWGTVMDSEWDLLGAQSASEEFTLTGRAVVTMPGSGPEQQTLLVQRAAAITAQIETIMRTNYRMPTMTGAVRDALLTEIETVPLYTDAGLVLLVPFSIRVNSQIRQV